jgi:oligopeptide transport system ATP-binding protein
MEKAGDGTAVSGHIGPILSVKDLVVSFVTYQGEVQAVRGVSWHLDESETIAIVGESGCGKTVTIQTVLGTNPKGVGKVKQGEILFRGESLLSKTQKEMRAYQGDRLSMIFQDPFTYLNPTMAVGEQILENYRQHHKVSRRRAEARVLEIMRLINMPSPEKNMRRYPHQLSGGMRQRIMIAIAIICEPEVLFADEPTTALDVTIQAQIIDLMNSLKRELKTAIVLVTHDMGVVANMADRIYIMYAGKIVEHGSSDEIFGKAMHPYTRGLLGSVPRVDRRSTEDLAFIKGSPPDPIAPPRGCAFAPRCPHAMNICIKEEPGFVHSGEAGHYHACWLHHQDHGAEGSHG